jgi:hypothetical protein
LREALAAGWLALVTAAHAEGPGVSAIPLIKAETLCVPVVSSRTMQSGLAPNNRGGWSFIGQFMNYYGTWDLATEAVPLPNGRHYLAFKNLQARPEAEWVIADLQTGGSKIVRWPGFHAGLVGAVLAGNGRLFFAVDYGQIYYYEPAEDTVKPMGRVWDDRLELRGFYKFILGPDGMIYGSAQASVGVTMLIQLNPDTLEYKLFRNVGLKGRREGLTYGYYLAVEPPWMYVAVGQGNWELFAINAETGSTNCLADVQGDGTRIVCDRSADGCTAEIIRPSSPMQRVQLIDGAAIPIDPATKKPDAASFRERKYKPVEWKLTKPMDLSGKPELDTGKRAIAIDRNGCAEIVWRPAGSSGDWNRIAFAISNAAPVKIESLIALPDGSLFGNAEAYNGFFRYTPGTKHFDFFGKFPPSRPGLALLDGRAYLSGYPNTMLLVYDPAQPWTATGSSDGKGANDNPRHLGTMGQGCTEAHYCRKLLNGGNGRLYLMGLRERWSTGTGLGYYEVANRRFFGLGKANKEIHPVDMAILPGIGRLVFSGKPDAGGDARLIVFDMDLNETDRLVIRPGLTAGGSLFNSDVDSQFFGCVAGPETNRFTLYRYDLKEKKIVTQTDIPAEIDAVLSRQADGTWWAISGDTLQQLDPASLALQPVGKLEGGIRHAVWIGKDLFGSRGGELVRVALP